MPLGWIVALGTLLAILVLLFIVGSTSNTDAQADNPEGDLVAIVRPALRRAGYNEISVRAEGRKIIMTGELQTRADVVAANAIAHSIADVATVDNRLTFVGEPQLGDVITEESGPVVEGSTTSAALLVQSKLSGIAARDPIQFETGSTELAAGSATTISQVATVLLDNPATRIEIGGYTDSDGDDEANTALSQSRADAVSTALIAADISVERISAFGYGEANPVASNETQEGKARNRRIEFLVLL